MNPAHWLLARQRSRSERAAADELLGQLVNKGSQVEEGVFVHPLSVIKSQVSLGRGSRINGPAVVRGKGRLRVGRWSAIGEELRVITSNHPITGANVQRSLQLALGIADHTVPGEVSIGPATWVGDRVTMLPGADVGAGVVLAAGAVVARGSLPPFVVAGGVPARVIHPRFTTDMVELLLELAWWDWDAARMRRNLGFLSADLTRLDAASVARLVND